MNKQANRYQNLYTQISTLVMALLIAQEAFNLVEQIEICDYYAFQGGLILDRTRVTQPRNEVVQWNWFVYRTIGATNSPFKNVISGSSAVTRPSPEGLLSPSRSSLMAFQGRQSVEM